MKKKKYVNLFTAATAFTIVATAVAPGVTNAAYFSDIQDNTHKDAIIHLVNKGLINGYTDGTFRPNKELTNSDVVKLVGRYLEKNGYKIPSDYKSNMRFSDLSPYHDEELLQYAALLKDEGIYIHKDGRLYPREEMTRENMAVILVNTLTTIHQFDYRSYVYNKNYNRKVTDLYDAMPNARASIDVLDYYDVTVVNKLKTNDYLTRGQLAPLLDRLLDVEKEEWLNLSKAEISNNQIKLQFTEKVNLSSTTDAKKLAKHFILSNMDDKELIDLTKGELSEDGRTYVVTMDIKDLDDLDGNYLLEIKNIESKSGKTLNKYKLEFSVEHKIVKEKKRKK